MKHNAIFISNYGAGKASVVKLDEQAYSQFTSPNDAEFGKFKKAYADGKLGVMPTLGYSAGVGIPLDKYPSRGVTLGACTPLRRRIGRWILVY